MVDERISRAIDNDHTAAMKITSDGRKIVRKKNGSTFTTTGSVFVCTICKKLFRNHLIYRRHLKIHSDKSFTCQICDKSFVHKHYLISHMLSHTKNQLYQCHLCHKRFSQKGNLNQHLKFHASQKPFRCEVCKKDFYQQEHFKAHMRQHNNEKPYRCETCNKSFNIKSSLQRHMNCHTGAKPFICDICHRGYTRRSVLMLHIQQVHENKKPYQCSECQMCFSQKGNLQAHFKRKHLEPKSENRRYKEKDRSKRTARTKQSSRQNSAVVKKVPAKSVSNVSKVTGKNAMPNIPKPCQAPLSNGPQPKDSAEVRKNVKISDSDETNLSTSISVPDIVPSSSSSQEILPLRLESSELFRLLNSGEDILDDSKISLLTEFSSSQGEMILPDLHSPYTFPNDSLQDDNRDLGDFDMLFNDPKDWEDYLLSESELLEPSVVNDLLSTPSKVSNGLSKNTPDEGEELFPNLLSSCHDYASPISEVTDDIPPAATTNSNKPSSTLRPKLVEKKPVLKSVHKIKRNMVMFEPQSSTSALNLGFFNQHKVHLSTGTTVFA